MPSITKQTTRPQKNMGSVLDRIRPLGFGDEEGLKMLLYGKSGTGKTTLWATFPKPILAIICSGGNKPGELKSINTEENRKGIKQVSLEATDEMRELIPHAAERYKTIVLDHASGFQDLALKEVLGLEELPEQKSWGMAKRDDYVQSMIRCKEFFRAMLNLSMNVIFISQERVFRGGDDENSSGSDLIQPVVGADLYPRLTDWLNPACDYVCQTFLRPKIVRTSKKVAGKTIVKESRGKGIEYVLRTAPHEVFMTKFRMPRGIGTDIPEVIVDPTYDKIVTLIKGD